MRARADRLRSSRCSACCSASAWAASGRAARRSSPRRGRPSTAARRSASCRARGRSATRAAALVTGVVLPRWGWRAVFFVGVLPALLHALDPPPRRRSRRSGRRAQRERRGAARAGICRRCSARAASPALTIVAHADERLHAVRVVGLQPVAARLPVARRSRRAASACRAGAMSVFVVAMQVGHVVRLRHLWLRQRSRSAASATYVTYLVAGGRAAAVYVSRASPLVLLAARAVRRVLRAPATSAASARSPRRSIRRRSAPRRRASPTTSAASPAPPRRSGRHAGRHARLRRRALSARPLPARRVAWIWIPETRGGRSPERDPHPLAGRLSQPPPGGPELVLELADRCARRPPDHGAGNTGRRETPGRPLRRRRAHERGAVTACRPRCVSSAPDPSRSPAPSALSRPLLRARRDMPPRIPHLTALLAPHIRDLRRSVGVEHRIDGAARRTGGRRGRGGGMSQTGPIVVRRESMRWPGPRRRRPEPAKQRNVRLRRGDACATA